MVKSSEYTSHPPLTVFISYSHNDTAYKEELEKAAVNQNIRFVSDVKLKPGDVWAQRLQGMRKEADVFLLLISENYLQSVRKEPELDEIIARWKADPKLRVIPVILEPSNWQLTPIANFQGVPRFGKPVSLFTNRHEAYAEIIDALLTIAELRQNAKALDLIRQENEKQTGTLTLVECGLRNIPRDLLDMPWLTELCLDRNYIRKLENLEKLTELKKLSITYNEIERIEHLESLTRLEVLDMQYNKLRAVGDLSKNEALVELGLSSNQLESLSGIRHLRHLQILYASHNRLGQIDELKNLPNLKRIVLTSNRIQSIRPLLKLIEGGMKVALEYSFNKTDNGLFIKDNSTLAEPFIEVIEQGRLAVLKYFADAATYKTQKLEILKLILVGNSKVGKTNFSEFLRGIDLAQTHNSTHLLDIQSWDASFLRSESGEPMRVNIFDFGGQDYYHDSHRMYYSHDTAYVLLWDTSTNQYEKQLESVKGQADALIYENFPLEYWLESIQYNLTDKYQHTYQTVADQAPKLRNTAPVLVLQNKIDLGEGQLDQKMLSGRYPNIAGFFSLSLTQKKRTAVLLEVLSDYLNDLNLSGRQLITFQHKIITDFLNHERSFQALSLDEFRAECVGIIDDESVEFTGQNAQIVAQILNSIGIVYYAKRANTDGVVFTRINRLNELIKEIMDVAKRGNDKGFFHREQLQGIEYLDEVLNLLLKNNSILKINDAEFLAPQFLPTEADPSVKFFLNAFTHHNLRYVYRAYFHKTLLLNLFAEYLNAASIDTSAGVKYFPFWRNGIIVSRGEDTTKQMVFVEMDKNETEGIINIRTMTPFSKDGLEQEIESTLDRLNQGWTVSKQISTNGQDFFDVAQLQADVRNNQFQFFTEGGKVFSVNDFKHIVTLEKLPKKLFISYSSKNSEFIRRFVTHLEVLRSSGLIDPWYDRMIESGSRWDDTIRGEMKNSDVIIFLLSPDFLATEYIMKTELPLAIEQLQNDTAKFFFIQLQPCGWERTPVANYQQTDDPANPHKNIISIGEPNNDKEWNRVINELVKKMES